MPVTALVSVTALVTALVSVPALVTALVSVCWTAAMLMLTV